MSLKNWSTTAASNNAAPPDGAPEGMTIANTNNVMRQIMADVRTLAASDTIASATTCDLGSKDATFLTVSGTTTITGLGTVSAGIYKFVVFSGALTLTHNGTSLILPGAANITTVAGDCALFLSLGSGNWKCLFYQAVTAASYQPLDTDLTAIAALTTEAFGRSLLTQVDAGEARTTLGAQETLVSGTNIKTVNGGSLLGSGEALPVPGTSGNLLTSNGSAWVSQAAPSTSPWVLISTTNATSVAAIDFTWDESLYGSVVLLLDGVGPASDNQNLHMRFGYSNGSTIDATGGAYTSFITSKLSTNTPEEITHNTFTLAVLADHSGGKVGNLTAEVMNAVIEVTAAGSGTSSGVGATARGSFINASGIPVSFITRVLHSTGTPRAYDTVRLLWEPGNFAAKGTIKLYGLKRS